MRHAILILIFCVSSLGAKPSSLVIGMSEKMGLFGMINASYDLPGLSKDQYKFSVEIGSIMIAGGAGISWKRYFNSSRITPFSSASVTGTYILSWCQTDNCDNPAQLGLMLTGALGYDFYLIKSDRMNIHLQLGVLSQYDFINKGIFESPSDKPEIWPVINLKFGR